MKSLEKVKEAMALLKEAKELLPAASTRGSTNIERADVDLTVAIIALEEIKRSLEAEIALQDTRRRRAQERREQMMRDLL